MRSPKFRGWALLGAAALFTALPAATHNILRFRDVTVCYGRTPALQQVTLDIPCGSSTAFSGPDMKAS